MKRSAIERLLPFVFRRAVTEGSPLAALLAVMEALHEPSEAVLRRLDTSFDPRRTTEAFVPYLAGWVDLEPLFERGQRGGSAESMQQPLSTGLGRLRELGAAAALLSQWRGTPKGLLLFLETATGVRGFTLDERPLGPDGRPRPYHVRILAPHAAAPHRALIERIIEFEKPVHVTHELAFEVERQPDDRVPHDSA